MADKRERGQPKHGCYIQGFGNLVRAPVKTDTGYKGTIASDGIGTFDVRLRDELVERLGKEPTKQRLLFMGRLLLTPVTLRRSNGQVQEFMDRELDGEVGPEDMDATYVVASGSMKTSEVVNPELSTARGYVDVTPWSDREVPMTFSVMGRFGKQVEFLQNRRHVLAGGFLRVKEDKGKLFYNITMAKVQFSSFVHSVVGHVTRSTSKPEASCKAPDSPEVKRINWV